MERIIRFPELKKVTGMSRSTIWREEHGGRFPRRIRISKGIVGWKESEVQKWIADTSNACGASNQQETVGAVERE